MVTPSCLIGCLFALFTFPCTSFGQLTATTLSGTEPKFAVVTNNPDNEPPANQRITGIRKVTSKIGNAAKSATLKINDFRNEHRVAFNYGIVPVALTAAWYSTYSGVDAELQEESQEAQTIPTNYVASRIEPLGRSRYLLPAFGGLMAYGLVAKSPRARKTAAIGVSTLLINNYVTGNLKAFFNRHRPNSGSEFNTWDGPEGATGKNHSFPSSHTSTAFAAATVLATAYKDHKWVPVVAYSTATMVGLSRIYQDHHWASDVLAGAVVGFVTAKGTYAAYEFIERKLRIKKPVMLVPQAGPQGFGLSATMAF